MLVPTLFVEQVYFHAMFVLSLLVARKKLNIVQCKNGQTGMVVYLVQNDRNELTKSAYPGPLCFHRLRHVISCYYHIASSPISIIERLCATK